MSTTHQGTAEQWIKEGEGGGEDDAAELPSVSVHRGAPVTERDRLSLGEPVAAAGAGEEDRQPVAYQLAKAAGEDRGPTRETRPVLMPAARGVPPDVAALWSDAANDRGITTASGIDEP